MVEVRKNANGKLVIFKDGEEFKTGAKVLLSSGLFVHTDRGNGTLSEYGEKVFLLCTDGATVEL